MSCSSSTMLIRAATRLSSRRLSATTTTTTFNIIRSYASAEMASGSTSSTAPPTTNSTYESPFDDFFTMIQQGRTSLGTTNDSPIPEEVYLKCGVKESALRFRTMHYGRMQLAPHIQPGEHSVTLKLHTRDLPLSPTELGIVQEIVGNRLDLQRGELRLASNVFGSRIENKRHLVSMLDRIVLGAKRLAQDLNETNGEMGNESEDNESKDDGVQEESSSKDDTETEDLAEDRVNGETDDEKR